MKAAYPESLVAALYALIGGRDGERNTRLIIEYVLAKASSGHLGFLRYVFAAVDGPIRPTAEDEMISEPVNVLVVVDDGREVEPARAA